VAVAAVLRHRTPEDAADRQPAQSNDGSLLLVGDMRIDNRADLARALGIADRSSVPDSAFVLAAYDRWGEAMLDRLFGDFALAVVDRRRGGVLLARDHVGASPLVVHERPGAVAFASTALALTGLKGVGHALDTLGAAEYLAVGICSERTFVEGVRRVPPATALWIDASGVRRWKWWDPDPTKTVDLGSPGAHERDLRGALDDAVAARLRSTGDLGALMSGGLDSTSVAATAATMLAPHEIRTYTAAPPAGWDVGKRPGWDADESALVRALAELHPNMSPRFLNVSPGATLLGGHEELWELGAGPTRNPCNWLWMYAARRTAAAEGVTTLLTGHRGNFHFSADGSDWLAELVRAGRIATAAREAVAWRRASGQSAYRVLRTHFVSPLLPPGVSRWLRKILGRKTPRDEWIAMAAVRPEVHAALDLARLNPLLDKSLPQRVAELASLQGGFAEQAETGLVAAALTGVEFRDATGDRRILEVALRQPEWTRRHDGIARAVARGAMADRLPPAIVARTRRGEQLPNWLDVMTAARGELVAELEELRGHPLSRQLIDTDRLRALVDHWPDRAARADPLVVRDYRLALLRALMVGRYLRWFETRSKSARSATVPRVWVD
jgi:asparagine synthase (glutamine-hydrolysing)